MLSAVMNNENLQVSFTYECRDFLFQFKNEVASCIKFRNIFVCVRFMLHFVPFFGNSIWKCHTDDYKAQRYVSGAGEVKAPALLIGDPVP